MPNSNDVNPSALTWGTIVRDRNGAEWVKVGDDRWLAPGVVGMSTGSPNPRPLTLTGRLTTHGGMIVVEREAYASGLAEWAAANGYVGPDGSPLVHSAGQRRTVERARARQSN